MVNEFGQVIGLNSSKIASTEYEGMGFAVPSKTIIEIYESILANGYVKGRPMLGITYLPITEDEFYNEVAQTNDLPAGSIVIASISNSSDVNNTEAEELLNKQKVACVPGTAFGQAGEGFIRVSYAYSLEELKIATEKIKLFLAELNND